MPSESESSSTCIKILDIGMANKRVLKESNKNNHSISEHGQNISKATTIVAQCVLQKNKDNTKKEIDDQKSSVARLQEMQSNPLELSSNNMKQTNHNVMQKLFVPKKKDFNINDLVNEDT